VSYPCVVAGELQRNLLLINEFLGSGPITGVGMQLALPSTSAA